MSYKNRDNRILLYSDIRTLKEYYIWRETILERDNYKDFFSGESGNDEELNVHHIISLKYIYRKNKIKTKKEIVNCFEIWDIDNGITLLKKNHQKDFHRLYTFKNPASKINNGIREYVKSVIYRANENNKNH